MDEEKELWDLSTEKAKELNIEDFGSPEEIQEMAKVERFTGSYSEIRNILKEFVGKPLQSKSGLTVTVSNKSIEKILSGKAIDKSVDKKAHFFAAVNLDKLFPYAIEPYKFPMDPNKNNENYRAVRRLYAPMAYGGRILPVKFTVMELLNEYEGKRLYSLEAIDVNLGKKI
jgi:hypothetical protein